jgi:hypothetical protein
MARLLGTRLTMVAIVEGDGVAARSEELAHLLAHSVRADSRFLEGRLDLADYDPERLVNGMFERARRRAVERLRPTGQPILPPSLAYVLIVDARLVCAAGGQGLVVAELDTGDLRACARTRRRRTADGDCAPAELLRIEQLPAARIRRLLLYPRVPDAPDASEQPGELAKISRAVVRHVDAELTVGADLVKMRSDGLAVAVLTRRPA